MPVDDLGVAEMAEEPLTRPIPTRKPV
jgi:aerobic C4-dicarboxylate transport protein